jgi:hypothetical protein
MTKRLPGAAKFIAPTRIKPGERRPNRGVVGRLEVRLLSPFRDRSS